LIYQHILVLIPGLFAIVHVNSPSWRAAALISVKVWMTWNKKTASITEIREIGEMTSSSFWNGVNKFVLQNNQDFRFRENKIETLKNGTFSNSRLSRVSVLSNSMWSILTTALDCHNPIWPLLFQV
jgi:hypothetical protein